MKLPFSKVTPFSLTTEIDWNPQALNLLLQQMPYREIKPEQRVSCGFIPAIGNGDFVEKVGADAVFIRFKHTEKAIPKSLVNKKVDEKVALIKEEEDRDVRRPERVEIMDAVILELIPQAFPKDHITCAILTPTHIFVDTTSASKAENVLSCLRAVIGTLPVQMLVTQEDPKKAMTELMLGRTKDEKFGLGERFKAKSTGNQKCVVSGTHINLDEEGLQQLVDDKREVVELELTYLADEEQRPTWFVLTKDLALKGIVWPPELSDAIMNEVGEDTDGETMMRASLHILCGALREMVNDLAVFLSGEVFGANEGRKPEEGTLFEALGNLAEKIPELKDAIMAARLGQLDEISSRSGLKTRFKFGDEIGTFRHIGDLSDDEQEEEEKAAEPEDWEDLI